MKLDQIRALISAASPGPWGTLPGVGENEDEGCFDVGAVGPSYSFLVDDYWDEENGIKPMHILHEEEAQRRAKADQMFLSASRTLMPKLVQVLEDAIALCDVLGDRDAYPMKANEQYWWGNLKRSCRAALESDE